jgi:hypothetical protein
MLACWFLLCDFVMVPDLHGLVWSTCVISFSLESLPSWTFALPHVHVVKGLLMCMRMRAEHLHGVSTAFGHVLWLRRCGMYCSRTA